MPQVPVAPEGSLAAAVGAPGFACVPGKDVTGKVVDAAREASLTDDRGTRNELERASTKHVQELRLAPAVASAVANLKAGMDQVTQSGAQLKAACLTALYLGVFVALAPVAANLGLSQVAILCALATSTDSDVLTSTDSGFLTSDAGIMDLKLFKLLGIVFQTIPSYGAFVSDFHTHVGMSGMAAHMGFFLMLYRMQPLHKRVDLVIAMITNTATPFHDIPWGGLPIQPLIASLKVKHTINVMMTKLVPLTKNFLSLVEHEVCLQICGQPRTPIDMALLRNAMLKLLPDEDCTFLMCTQILQEQFGQSFPVSTIWEEINDGQHEPDVNGMNRPGSPAKRPRGEDKSSATCKCCKKPDCSGVHDLVFCPKSRHAGGEPLKPMSTYPQHVKQLKPFVPFAKRACRDFTSGGTCRFGDRCKFAHDAPSGAAAPPRAPRSETNQVVMQEDNGQVFQEFQLFQEFRGQAAAQAAAAGQVELDGECYSPVTRTHHGLFRLCMRDVRLSSKLPCGRQGNPLLAMLLVHRFRTATNAKSPEVARNLITKTHGMGLGSKQTVRSAIRASPDSAAAHDSAMNALTVLIQNPLFPSQISRARTREHRRPLREMSAQTTNKNRNQTNKNRNQTVSNNINSKKTDHSKKTEISKSSIPDLSAADRQHAFNKRNIGQRRKRNTHKPGIPIPTPTKIISDADIIRYTLTPVPVRSKVTKKVIEESAMRMTSRVRKFYRLPRLTRRKFLLVHQFLEKEQDKQPAKNAEFDLASVSAATEKRTRKADYASGSCDDTSVRYPDAWTDPSDGMTEQQKSLLADIETSALERRYRQVLAPMETYDIHGAPAVNPRRGTSQPVWFDKHGNHTHGYLNGIDCYGLPPCLTPASVSADQHSTHGIHDRPAKRFRVETKPTGTESTFVAQNDCGTNVHTTNDFNNFITYKSYNQPKAVSVANGQQVYALGEGRVCIALPAEILQKYQFQQRHKDERIRSDQTMHIVLDKCLHVPTFKQNFLDETQVRKTPGIHIVGDSLSKRIVDTTRGLQYTMSESAGQEYVRGQTLTKQQFVALKSVPQVHSFAKTQVEPTRPEKKQIRRSMQKLSMAELKTIVGAPAIDARYSPYERESARIELCRSGVYTYNHGQSDLLLKFHHLLSHASMATTVRTMRKMGVIGKLDKGARLFCMHCLMARPRRIAARKSGVSDHKNKIFSKFFVDCAGPFTPAAGTLNQYAMTVIDRCSGQNYTYYCKSQKEVPELFKKFLVDVKLDLAKAGVREIDVALGKMIVQTDNASVFAGANTEFSKLLESLNIKKVHGLAYTAQHQAKVERFFGTIKERTRSLLRSAGLDEMYWELAWKYCTSVYNYIDNTSTLHSYSPYQMVTGKDPTNFLKSLKPFGARCVVTVPTNTKSTTYEAIYLGHSIDADAPDHVSGHWVLDTRGGRTKIKRVHNLRVMDEVPKPMADNTIVNLQSKFEDDDDQLQELWSAIDLDEIMDESEISEPDHADTQPSDSQPGTPEAADTDFLIDQNLHTPSGQWTNVDLFDPEQHAEFSSVNAVNALIEKEYPTMGAEIITAHVSDKIHYTRAAAIADNAGYAESDRKELAAMDKHDVWDTVPITSLTDNERSQLCRAHMLRYPKFSGEINGERQVEKLKSRLVFDGRSQSKAQSGNWTASNTPRQSTIMLHFGMAPLCENEVFMSTDISTAFLRAPQHTADGSRCVMRMPKDIATFTMVNGKPVENVHILKRSLYGQRQSSLAYEKLFVSWACDDPKGPQLKRSTVDPCVFYSKSGLLRMIVFVDDCNWRGCPKESAELVKMFETRWQTECKPCKYFLNMRLGRNDEGYINVSQPHYADHMAKVFDLQSETKVAKTPLPPGTSVSKLERVNFQQKTHHKMEASKVTAVQHKSKKHRLSPNEKAVEASQRKTMDAKTNDVPNPVATDALVGKNLTRFKEAWGQLSYYATATRPDLCYAVSLLGQVSAGPRMRHWRLAQQVIKYAYHTRTHGIQFRKTSKVNHIECYVDSSFGEGPLARSQTGYVFMFNGGPISWASRLQSHTATSTMEAETSAACDAAKENAFLRDLCHEMGKQQKSETPIHAREQKVHPKLWVKPPIEYHEDNAACLAFNHQINVTRRNRHMGRPFNLAEEPADLICADRCHRVNFHSLRDHIADGEAIMTKCDTEEMLADILTKALNTDKTGRFRDRMLCHIPIILDAEPPPAVTKTVTF